MSVWEEGAWLLKLDKGLFHEQGQVVVRRPTPTLQRHTGLVLKGTMEGFEPVVKREVALGSWSEARFVEARETKFSVSQSSPFRRRFHPTLVISLFNSLVDVLVSRPTREWERDLYNFFMNLNLFIKFFVNQIIWTCCLENKNCVVFFVEDKRWYFRKC